MLNGLSDFETVQALRCDLRWKAACGLGLYDTAFGPSLLAYFRRRLSRSADPQRIFTAVRAVVAETGILKGKVRRALDSTVLDDAVARLETPLIGGMCIIQAKRYKDPIPVEAVRVLAGSMHDMNAIKGIVVATSWFGKASIDFATRSGRIELIDGRNLKALLKQHLGLDVLIGLPTISAGWNRSEVS